MHFAWSKSRLHNLLGQASACTSLPQPSSLTHGARTVAGRSERSTCKQTHSNGDLHDEREAWPLLEDPSALVFGMSLSG